MIRVPIQTVVTVAEITIVTFLLTTLLNKNKNIILRTRSILWNGRILPLICARSFTSRYATMAMQRCRISILRKISKPDNTVHQKSLSAIPTSLTPISGPSLVWSTRCLRILSFSNRKAERVSVKTRIIFIWWWNYWVHSQNNSCRLVKTQEISLLRKVTIQNYSGDLVNGNPHVGMTIGRMLE